MIVNKLKVFKTNAPRQNQSSFFSTEFDEIKDYNLTNKFFFGHIIFYFILMTLCPLNQKGQETIVLFVDSKFFYFTKEELTVKVQFFIICTPLNIHVVSENLVQTSLFLSIIISLGNVKGTDKSVASVFLCEARCLLFKSLFPMYAAFRYSLSENHLYFMYFMFSLFSQHNSLLNIFFAHLVLRLFAN